MNNLETFENFRYVMEFQFCMLQEESVSQEICYMNEIN